MLRVIFVFFISLMICSCSPFSASDEERISTFEQLCREHASEEITEESADGKVILGELISSDESIGSANLPALDLEYSSGFLLRNLFSGHDKLREVVFSSRQSGANIPETPRECLTTHYVLVRNAEEAHATFLHKCDPTRIVKSIEDTRYAIVLEYGDLNDKEIRPFIFQVKDRHNGRVLAEQKSYQLLMGAMKNKELRVRHGWGSSQGARTCKLTPPDQVVKKVFR